MPHIIKNFDSISDKLRDETLNMAAQTRINLERAFQALIKRDKVLANLVIADDDEVDQFEREIDRIGLDILVRYHPVASDLRLVLTAMKMAKNLERISDHATSIAKRAKKLTKKSELPETALIEPIYTLTDHLLRDAIKAFADKDATLASSLQQRDQLLDEQHVNLLNKLKQSIETLSESSECYLHLILISRSLERIGDLAANMGEDIVFLTTAQDIRHPDNKI